MRRKILIYMMLGTFCLSLLGCGKIKEDEEVTEAMLNVGMLSDAEASYWTKEIDGVKYDVYEDYAGTGKPIAKAEIVDVNNYKMLKEYKSDEMKFPVTIFGGVVSETEEYTVPEQFLYYAGSSYEYGSTQNKVEGVKKMIIPDTIKYVNVNHQPFGHDIEEVILPEGLECYGTQNWDETFSSCMNLKSFTIPNGATELKSTFYFCKSLKEVNLPDSIEILGDLTFKSCEALEEIYMPDNVEIIGKECFAFCESLKNIDIPDSVKVIGANAFAKCTSLSAVALPDSLETIEEMTFFSCTSLSTIAIPDSVKTIRESAFSECSALTEIAIPDSVETIEEIAFAKCTSLTKVTLSDSLKTIEERAFEDCDNLAQIIVPVSVSEDIFVRLQEEYPNIEIIRE